MVSEGWGTRNSPSILFSLPLPPLLIFPLNTYSLGKYFLAPILHSYQNLRWWPNKKMCTCVPKIRLHCKVPQNLIHLPCTYVMCVGILLLISWHNFMCMNKNFSIRIPYKKEKWKQSNVILLIKKNNISGYYLIILLCQKIFLDPYTLQIQKALNRSFSLICHFLLFSFLFLVSLLEISAKRLFHSWCY